MIEHLLHHHGDRDALPGLVDLAVNVRPGMPPAWLRERIASADLAGYPDQRAARQAVAARHGRDPAQVLLTAGAAEAFVLIARALRPARAAVIHPQFTEPELALRVAGHDVHRVVLEWPFTLERAVVPDECDLVVIGNPTNPTSVLHRAAALRSLLRPGRHLVVDEAFADCVPGEPESFASAADLDGLVIVRSLTKTWGLAGLRVGYVLAPEATVAALRAVQHAWPVSAPALEACVATSEPSAVAAAQDWAEDLIAVRTQFAEELEQLPGVRVVPGASASFVLVDTARHGVRERLHRYGLAVRRGETFPGLGESWIRIAVRDPATNRRLVTALADCLQLADQLPEHDGTLR